MALKCAENTDQPKELTFPRRNDAQNRDPRPFFFVFVSKLIDPNQQLRQYILKSSFSRRNCRSEHRSLKFDP